MKLFSLFLTAICFTAMPTHTQDLSKEIFGTTQDGQPVELYTLTNKHHLEVQIMTLGATLISVKTPDKKGTFDTITLRLDTFEDYQKGHPLFGSIVGRFANRIGGAAFSIDGIEYKLTPNSGQNHIHGGRTGFQKLLWKATPSTDNNQAALQCTLTSPDGSEGYPGTVNAQVTYILTNKNELILEYQTKTDKATHVNLTNHMYWNLSGAGSGSVLAHQVTLNADHYLEFTSQKIPTGKYLPVAGTAMDFTKPTAIGERIDQVDGNNYDHCYVFNTPGSTTPNATIHDPQSGRNMDIYTTQPGAQLYTARSLNERYHYKGKSYGPYHGVCLETQHFPDTPNHPHFPSSLLRPGETYSHQTKFVFSVR
jgi:aldose 1-epimerase